jgi:hypothetical protein
MIAMKIVITHAGALPWKDEFYKAIQNSDFYKSNKVFLPQEKDKPEQITKERVEHSDLVIAEVSYPSTGQGIELGWADIYHRPIICVYKEKSVISNSLTFITSKFVLYKDSKELILKLEKMIREIF